MREELALTCVKDPLDATKDVVGFTEVNTVVLALPLERLPDDFLFFLGNPLEP